MHYEDVEICGYHISSWISLTEETYSITSTGALFNGWPDGKPLMEQEQCVVEILKHVLLEVLKDIKDGKT